MCSSEARRRGAANMRGTFSGRGPLVSGRAWDAREVGAVYEDGMPLWRRGTPVALVRESRVVGHVEEGREGSRCGSGTPPAASRQGTLSGDGTVGVDRVEASVSGGVSSLSFRVLVDVGMEWRMVASWRAPPGDLGREVAGGIRSGVAHLMDSLPPCSSRVSLSVSWVSCPPAVVLATGSPSTDPWTASSV